MNYYGIRKICYNSVILFESYSNRPSVSRTRTVARGIWMQDGCATLRDLVGDQSANVRTVFTMNGSRHHGEARR